jgi:hypothetical protein
LLLKRTRVLVASASGIVLLILIVVMVSALASRPAHHSVTLNWHPPVPVKNVGIAGYNVYRSVTPGGPYVRIASGVTGLTYHDSIVNNGITYYYVVTSVDAAGDESTYSTEAHARIP